MHHGLNLFLSILGKFGWLGNWLFLLIALAECVPFVGSIFPGGTLIVVGGFFAGQGYFSAWNIMIYATIGAIIGDYSGYSLGRWGGDWLIRKQIIKPELIVQGETFFKKYGAPSIVWGRFIGATRAVVPFIAGSTKMKQRYFLFWNIIGAVVWSAAHVLLGYFSGNIIAIVIKKWSHRLSLILSITLVVAFFYWLIKKHHQNIWRYFKKQSARFTEALFASRWFKWLDERYPVISEFFQTRVSQERIFGGFLVAIILVILYILTIALDWI